MNDVSENLGDASHFFFFPALVNIYNLDEFDLEEMLHYLAYSGSIIGLVNLLDTSMKVVRYLILGLMSANDLMLQQWIYFARKFKRISSLKLLRAIKSKFRAKIRCHLADLVINASISVESYSSSKYL